MTILLMLQFYMSCLCLLIPVCVYVHVGMMATQLNEKVTSGELDKFAVIQVEKLIVNTVQNRK